MFSKLQDDEDSIRKNTLTIVSDLIVKGLIKPRGRMAEVAMLLLDENERIKAGSGKFNVCQYIPTNYRGGWLKHPESGYL